MNPELRKLQAWMEEYLLDQRWNEDSSQSIGSVPLSMEEMASSPASGQILLWPAQENAPPFYGMIWSAGYDAWWVFPFSPYATPATPEELRIREHPPVRVIQGWNVRKTSASELRGAWLVETLGDEAQLMVERWWLQLQSGGADRGGTMAEVGPSLVHPLDPRFTYLDQQRQYVDAFLGEVTPEAQDPQQRAAESSEEDDYDP